MKGCLTFIGVGLFILIAIGVLLKLFKTFLGLFERLILFMESHALTMLVLAFGFVGLIILVRWLFRKTTATSKNFED